MSDLELRPEVRAILEALLAQAEQPERSRVARVRLRAREYAWYQRGDELGLRAEVHTQLRWLEAQGWLRLRWQRYEEGNWLEAIDLSAREYEVLEGLYTLLGRVHQQAQREALRSLLMAQVTEGRADWFASFVSWALAQLEAYRVPLPLTLNKPRENADLLDALAALGALREPILERTLSVQVFGDSKRLGELRGGVLSVLRQHSPEAARYEDDWVLLEAYYLRRPADYTPLAGPLTLRFVTEQGEEAELRIDAGLPSLALPERLLREARIVACPARALITIENFTSFSELLQVRPAGYLVICSGGFASPALIAFLRQVRTLRPELACWHWGDLDAGGLRILAHLRQQVGGFKGLAMDVPTFKNHGQHARALTANDRENLRELLADPLFEEHRELLEELLASGQKLEQEGVGAAEVLGLVEGGL